jgi:S-(hydroxymethyl)mycothiol dehydrogenase
VDVAFEAVGSPDVLAQALASCDVGGTTVLIGVPVPGTNANFSLVKFFYTRGRLVSTFCGDSVPARDFPLLASLYWRGELRLDELVTRVAGLDDVEEAFEAMVNGVTLRTVLRP